MLELYNCISSAFLCKAPLHGAGEMGRLRRALGAKPGELSLIPGIHMVEGEN